MIRCLIFLVSLLCTSANASTNSYHFVLPSNTSLTPYVVYLKNNTLSKRVADYYAEKYRIDSTRLIGIQVSVLSSGIPVAEFKRIYEGVVSAGSESHRQIILAFNQPYRVGCMSITSAFAFGYDESFCSKKICDLTAKNPYYGSLNNTVLKEKRLYPTMMLAANSFERAKALIDRGVAAKNTWPQGQAYLVETSDQARSARKVIYPDVKQLDKLLPVNILQTEGIKDKNDILFYFTGTVSVPYLNTLGFVPGAVADHLTSAGGQLTDSSQMSAMRWLEAGATGSYGTVVEPCNHLAKFPDPRMLMYFYTKGNTLMEAYWKSVLMPGEGVFIGDPLARPFGGYRVTEGKKNVVLRTYSLMPGIYRIEVAESVLGPFRKTRFMFKAEDGKVAYRLPKFKSPVVRLNIEPIL